MTVFSDLKIFPMNLEKSNLVAKGSVVIDNTVRINFSVINGPTGRFVSMPSEKSTKTDDAGKVKYFPYISFVSRETSDELNRLVLTELDKGSAPAKATSGARPAAPAQVKRQANLPF